VRETLSKNIRGSDAEMGIKTFDSDVERSAREDLLVAFKDAPIPDAQILSNLGLFLDAKSLSRILLMDFLYKQIVPEPPWVCWRFHTWETRMESWTNTTSVAGGIRRKKKLQRFGW